MKIAVIGYSGPANPRWREPSESGTRSPCCIWTRYSTRPTCSSGTGRSSSPPWRLFSTEATAGSSTQLHRSAVPPADGRGRPDRHAALRPVCLPVRAQSVPDLQRPQPPRRGGGLYGKAGLGIHPVDPSRRQDPGGPEAIPGPGQSLSGQDDGAEKPAAAGRIFSGRTAVWIKHSF